MPDYRHYLLVGLLFAPLPAVSAPLSAAQTDWVKADALNAGISYAAHCGGAYVAPIIKFSDEASVEADRSEFIFDQDAILEGHVVVTNNDQEIRADFANYMIAENKLSLKGNISVRGNKLLLKGDSALFDTNATTGSITNASYLMHDLHIRGHAEKIERTSANSLQLINGAFTQCTPEDNTWLIQAKELTLNYEKGEGLARGATIRIKDVPVLYIPYMPFPLGNTRRSGLLWPSISSVNNAGGLDIGIPYYFNIAPQADATLTPRLVGSRGTGVEAELRYLNSYSEWALGGAYFNDTETNEQRWLSAVNEEGQFNDAWHHNINYTRVSDDDYFSDFDVTSLDVRRQTHLLQEANLSHWGKRINGQITVQQYQTILKNTDEPYKLLPQISLATNNRLSSGKLIPKALFEYSYFDSSNTNKAKGQRLYYETGLTLPFQRKEGFIRLATTYRGIKYDLDEQHVTPSADKEPSTESLVSSLDAGLYFERFGDKGSQTLEPRIFYAYSPYKDQAAAPIFDTRIAADTLQRRYQVTRISGHDRLESNNDLTLGLTSRLFNEQGREFLSIGLAQTYYLSDKRSDATFLSNLNTGSSSMISSIQWQPVRPLSMQSNITYNNDNDKIDRANWLLSYQNDDGLLLSAAEVYNRNATNQTETDQIELSAAIPFNEQWTLYAQHHYDLSQDNDVQNTLGFSYESCCWMVSALFQESLDDDDIAGRKDTGFYLQFELKGLGGTGSGVRNILRDTIYGYEE